MRPSIARVSEQLDPRFTDIPPPQSATLGLHPVARKLLFISRPAEGRRLRNLRIYSVQLRRGRPDVASVQADRALNITHHHQQRRRRRRLPISANCRRPESLAGG